jgi:hypothetical protein
MTAVIDTATAPTVQATPAATRGLSPLFNRAANAAMSRRKERETGASAMNTIRRYTGRDIWK